LEGVIGGDLDTLAVRAAAAGGTAELSSSICSVVCTADVLSNTVSAFSDVERFWSGFTAAHTTFINTNVNPQAVTVHSEAAQPATE